MSAEVALGEDARIDVLAAASSAERANRPVYLVFLASALLLAALIYLLVGVISSASAESDRVAEANAFEVIRREADALKALDDARNSPENLARFEPNPSIIAELIAIAAEEGLEGLAPNDQEDASVRVEGYTRRRIRATGLGAVSGDALFRWLARAVQIKGLEVQQFVLRPANAAPNGDARWNAEIVFVRWQRR